MCEWGLNIPTYITIRRMEMKYKTRKEYLEACAKERKEKEKTERVEEKKEVKTETSKEE